MTPERVLAKDTGSDRYMLLMGSSVNLQKEVPAQGKCILVHQKFPVLDFDPADQSKIEKGLFSMRTYRNSTLISKYIVLYNSTRDRYILLDAKGIVVASDLRTIALCQKAAVEDVCNKHGFELIQRY